MDLSALTMPQAPRRKSWDAGCCLPTFELFFCCEFRRKKPLLRRKGTSCCCSLHRGVLEGERRGDGKEKQLNQLDFQLQTSACLLSWWSAVLSIAFSLLFLPVPSAFLLFLSPSVSAPCSKAGKQHSRKRGSLLGFNQFETC